jgi:hypothetical protein
MAHPTEQEKHEATSPIVYEYYPAEQQKLLANIFPAAQV